MRKNTKKKSSGVGKTLAISAGVAALSAGAYYLFGPNAKAHQKKAKTLLTKLHKEAKVKIAKAKVVTGPIYHQTVDFLSATYAKQHKEHAPEIKAFANKLKREWKASKKAIIKKVSKTPLGRKQTTGKAKKKKA